MRDSSTGCLAPAIVVPAAAVASGCSLLQTIEIRGNVASPRVIEAHVGHRRLWINGAGTAYPVDDVVRRILEASGEVGTALQLIERRCQRRARARHAGNGMARPAAVVLDQLLASFWTAPGRRLAVGEVPAAAGERDERDQECAAERRSHRKPMKSAASGYARPAGIHMTRPASCWSSSA